MRGALLFVLSTYIISLLGVHALTLLRRDTPATIALDIKRRYVPDRVGRDRLRRKRDGTVDVKLQNEVSLYLCNVTLGTPPQSVELILDTGSSDLWCNSPNSTLCSSSSKPCSGYGMYDPSSSSTEHYVSSKFNISYADGSSASGVYLTDTLHIGGVTIEHFQFGVGYNSSSPQGVLGIGYKTNEVQVTRAGEKPYANLPQAMVNNGLVNATAYSLWLNDLNSNTGTVLFGGVNAKKYYGELQTLPILPIDGIYSEFIIALTGVSVNSASHSKSISSSDLPTAVLLDSGSTLSYLPDPVAHHIYKALNVTYQSSAGVGFVPCSYANRDLNVTYTFSSPAIDVSISELVLNSGDTTFSDGSPACIFGIVPAGNSQCVLGDTFLRSAYVVYDLNSNEISLAQTNFNASGDDILTIGTGKNPIPGATTVPHPVTSVVVGGGGARIGGASDKNGAPARLTPLPKHIAFGLLGTGFLMAF